ncbi:6890_t:CDS:2, partial [Acaulospora morrowiae]
VDRYKKQTGLKEDSAKSQTDKLQVQAEEQTKRQKASTAKALYRAVEPRMIHTKNGKKRKRSNKKKTQGQQQLDPNSTQKMEVNDLDSLKVPEKNVTSLSQDNLENSKIEEVELTSDHDNKTIDPEEEIGNKSKKQKLDDSIVSDYSNKVPQIETYDTATDINYNFESLEISEPTRKAIKEDDTTGRDVLGTAKTGSGNIWSFACTAMSSLSNIWYSDTRQAEVQKLNKGINLLIAMPGPSLEYQGIYIQKPPVKANISREGLSG